VLVLARLAQLCLMNFIKYIVMFHDFINNILREGNYLQMIKNNTLLVIKIEGLHSKYLKRNM